jgi:hypothetical protein
VRAVAVAGVFAKEFAGVMRELILYMEKALPAMHFEQKCAYFLILSI